MNEVDQELFEEKNPSTPIIVATEPAIFILREEYCIANVSRNEPNPAIAAIFTYP